MGPHGIPRGCQFVEPGQRWWLPQSATVGSPNGSPAHPDAPGGAHPLVMFQEYHRLAGVFAAYPAPLKPPQPCRDPGPGRVNHLHHHTPVTLSKSPHNQGNQPADCTTQHQAPEYLGCEPRSPDGSPPNRRADHTDHNDQATHSSSRKGQTPLEVLEDSEGRNPLITWDLDLYPQPRPTPTHPHSTQKTRFSCPQAGCACGQAEYRWARGTWARWEVDVVACARCVRPQCVAWPVRSSRPPSQQQRGCEHKKAPGRVARGFPSVGADDGNRTRVICLEGRGSTIELHPRTPRRGHEDPSGYCPRARHLHAPPV